MLTPVSPSIPATARRQDTTLGKNALVRQAFELSLDRQALIQVVYSGMFTPTIQANPPSSPFFFKDLTIAGARCGKGQGAAEAGRRAAPVPVTLTITNGSDIQQAGEVIQSMASEAGST